MAQANRVHSTPRKTASKIQTKKRAKVKRPAPDADAKLRAAASELGQIERTLSAMHKKYGDDADSRKDYLKLAGRRIELLQIFGSTPAVSQNDIKAKAFALSLPETLEDYARTALIAKSLAQDILKGLSLKGLSTGDQNPFDAKRAKAYHDMEPHVCDLVNMGTIAMDQFDKDEGLFVFAVGKLEDMLNEFRARYYAEEFPA